MAGPGRRRVRPDGCSSAGGSPRSPGPPTRRWPSTTDGTARADGRSPSSPSTAYAGAASASVRSSTHVRWARPASVNPPSASSQPRDRSRSSPADPVVVGPLPRALQDRGRHLAGRARGGSGPPPRRRPPRSSPRCGRRRGTRAGGTARATGRPGDRRASRGRRGRRTAGGPRASGSPRSRRVGPARRPPRRVGVEAASSPHRGPAQHAAGGLLSGRQDRARVRRSPTRPGWRARTSVGPEVEERRDDDVGADAAHGGRAGCEVAVQSLDPERRVGLGGLRREVDQPVDRLERAPGLSGRHGIGHGGTVPARLARRRGAVVQSILMQQVAPELVGPHDPLTATAPRRPASVRRTTTIDSIRADALSTQVDLDIRGRDLFTAADGSVSEIAAERADGDGRQPDRHLDLDEPVARRVGRRGRLERRQPLPAPTGGGRRPTWWRSARCWRSCSTTSSARASSTATRSERAGIFDTLPVKVEPSHVAKVTDVCAGWATEATILRTVRTAGEIPTPYGPAAPDIIDGPTIPSHGMRPNRSSPTACAASADSTSSRSTAPTTIRPCRRAQRSASTCTSATATSTRTGTRRCCTSTPSSARSTPRPAPSSDIEAAREGAALGGVPQAIGSERRLVGRSLTRAAGDGARRAGRHEHVHPPQRHAALARRARRAARGRLAQRTR